MTDVERQKYLEAYYDNEADANKQMSLANAAAAVYMLVIWIFYLTGFFLVYSLITKILINVLFPIGILTLLTPLLYVFKFKTHLRKPGYKYFVLYSFIFVIMTLNVILPKHSAIAWALCILMANHYYNPSVGTRVFISVLIASFLAMFGGMFFGEFDANLLFGNKIMESINTQEIYANGVAGRIEMLNKLYNMGNGFFDLEYNRYLGSVVFYFLPRGIILFLVFLVSYALNKRTYKLLVSEIRVNSEQAKAKTELEVAKEIQLATLPSEIASSKDVEIVAELRAAKEVGGDFYDYFQIDDDHTAIVVGDISGKGVPAAMFMMKTITCFKNFMAPNKKPSQILKEVNAALYDNNQMQMFVTCFLAILNKKTGVLEFANAGHNPPVIGSNLKYEFLQCKSGFILGGLEDAFVIDEKITLKPGESITLYTDGVTEARNEKGEFYGEERLINLFNSREFTCLVEIHHSLKDDMAKFTDNFEQSDDITVISLKFQGDDCAITENVFNAKIENIEGALAFVEQFCDEERIPVDFKMKLLVVADELYSNIVKYGYENNGGDVFTRLVYNRDKKEFAMTLIDKATPFNPLDVDNKPVSGNADDLKVGGLGILIVKTIMTECAYDRINNKNILVLKKKF
ncbi:MAG: SpoIIE family protein phosphatase [Bacilli bacterium]|nr:SpoIIE family protein phosphatase [Bacilli bacterium]